MPSFCEKGPAGGRKSGLYALQYRGQESCGIVINDDGVFPSHKDLGLVSEVLFADAFSRLPKGNMAVGHVRYGTTSGNIYGIAQEEFETSRYIRPEWHFRVIRIRLNPDNKIRKCNKLYRFLYIFSVFFY